MRAEPFVVATILFHASRAFAAEPMAPSDIQATFFNGQPFTAATLSGVKFKMTFTPDGKMTREPLAESGSKSAGTWRLNAHGFCRSWGRAKASCFAVVRTSAWRNQNPPSLPLGPHRPRSPPTPWPASPSLRRRSSNRDGRGIDYSIALVERLSAFFIMLIGFEWVRPRLTPGT